MQLFLTADHFDSEHCGGLGELGVSLGTELLDELLRVEDRAVALDVGCLEEVSLEGLLTRHRGGVLDAVLDRVGTVLEVFDLSQDHAELVDVAGSDVIDVHGGFLGCLLWCSDASVT